MASLHYLGKWGTIILPRVVAGFNMMMQGKRLEHSGMEDMQRWVLVAAVLLCDRQHTSTPPSVRHIWETKQCPGATRAGGDFRTHLSLHPPAAAPVAQEPIEAPGPPLPSSSLPAAACPAGQVFVNCSDLHTDLELSRERTCEQQLLNLSMSARGPCLSGCACPQG